jgi:uncharacterized membrane protein YfcA
MPHYLVLATIALSVFGTSFISGVLGMAGGMVLMGILLVLLPVPAAMMTHGVSQMASNGWRAWLWRREINWRVFRGTTAGMVLVVAAFGALQLVGSRAVVYILLGITPFIGMLLPPRLKLNVDKRGHSFACGAICTVMALLSGVSGPLLDVFFLHSKMDRRGVIATKAASQTLSHIFKIIYFGAVIETGRGAVELWFALTMIVLSMTATTMSRKFLERMTDADFRKWTRWTVTVIGGFYLCNGVWALAHG